MTQATQQAVSRVEAVINRQWAKMVKWQESRGCKWSLFDAEDTVQRASLLLFKWAVDGKYDGKTDNEVEKIFAGLVRQQGSNQWTQCHRDRDEYEQGCDIELSFGSSASHEESVDSMELIEQAFGEDLWIAQAMMAGESLNEIGTHRAKFGATTVKKRVKAASQRALELVAE